MSQVVVVATLRIAPDRVDEAHAALEAVVHATHAEAGCMAYAVHAVADDPATFVFVERWTSPIALEAHMLTPHFLAFRDAIGGLVTEPPQIVHLDPLPMGDPMKGSL